MNRTQYWIKRLFAIGMIYGAALSPQVIPLASWAQSSESPDSNQLLRFLPPPLSDQNLTQLADRGAPKGRTGSGTRGDCPPLTTSTPKALALVPLVHSQGVEKGDAIVLGLTTEARPTFWVYIPYDRSVVNRVQFVLLDEKEEPVMEPIAIPAQNIPGVVSVRLPETVPPLIVGKYYHWYATIDCQPQGTTDTYVEAMIQRVEPVAKLTQQLAKATPKERAQLYAESGIWYDALTQMQTVRQQSPNDTKLKAAWVSLLESVGLEAVAKR